LLLRALTPRKTFILLFRRTTVVVVMSQPALLPAASAGAVDPRDSLTLTDFAKRLRQQESQHLPSSRPAKKQRFKRELVKLPDGYVPSPYDVVTGFGTAKCIEGNMYLRGIIHNRVMEYLQGDLEAKSILVRSVVAHIRSRGGKFVRKNDAWGFLSFGDAHARKKVGHSFRDKVKTIKNRLSRRVKVLEASGDELPRKPVKASSKLPLKAGARASIKIRPKAAVKASTTKAATKASTKPRPKATAPKEPRQAEPINRSEKQTKLHPKVVTNVSTKLQAKQGTEGKPIKNDKRQYKRMLTAEPESPLEWLDLADAPLEAFLEQWSLSKEQYEGSDSEATQRFMHSLKIRQRALDTWAPTASTVSPPADGDHLDHQGPVVDQPASVANQLAESTVSPPADGDLLNHHRVPVVDQQASVANQSAGSTVSPPADGDLLNRHRGLVVDQPASVANQLADTKYELKLDGMVLDVLGVGSCDWTDGEKAVVVIVREGRVCTVPGSAQVGGTRPDVTAQQLGHMHFP
jgi:hypothetical protein